MGLLVMNRQWYDPAPPGRVIPNSYIPNKMGFVDLDDIHGLGDDANELVVDLHRKRSSPKIANLYGDLSGAVLKKPMRKTGVERSCCGDLTFVW